MADDLKGPWQEWEETAEAEVPTDPHPHPPQTNGALRWANGQCVLALPSRSNLNPSFDLNLCLNLLNQEGFQIPAGDLIGPLTAALDPPHVRRYIVLNSSLFHFAMAPILYVVVWCGLFSTVHRYMTVADTWVLCIGVSVVAICLTTAVVIAIHRGNKEMNMNLDVRLIQVNERLVRHKLLVGVADWVQNCSGTIQLSFIYWDMTSCLRTLTQTLETYSNGPNDLQATLSKRMSHLVLSFEVKPDKDDPDAADIPSAAHRSGEERPLLAAEDIERSTVTSLREDAKLATTLNLIPDPGLPAQDMASQLLLTHGAAYVRLLGSKRLPGSAPPRPKAGPAHCSTTAPLCLCQYVRAKVL